MEAYVFVHNSRFDSEGIVGTESSDSVSMKCK